MKHPFCRWCAPLALALSLGGWIGGSLFTARHPAKLRVVSVSAASPGDTAEITYNGSEKKFCDGVVHRWLIDKDNGYHDLTDTNVFRPDPGETPVTFYHDFDVPKKMPLGPAVYHSEVVRWCNFWQWLFYPIRDRYSAPFTVE